MKNTGGAERSYRFGCGDLPRPGTDRVTVPSEDEGKSQTHSDKRRSPHSDPLESNS